MQGAAQFLYVQQKIGLSVTAALIIFSFANTSVRPRIEDFKPHVLAAFEGVHEDEPLDAGKTWENPFQDKPKLN